MIELNASSENAFKLLNKGERKQMVFYSIKLKKNICGRTSLYFDETMFRNIKPDEQWMKTTIFRTFPSIYIFIEKKLLLTVNLWPEVEKFISRLDKSIMDSVRISHHPNWNGICLNGIKDEKCYIQIRR